MILICCMLHDKGYYNDKENEIMYDRMLCLCALEIAKDPDYSNHIRLKAMAIAKFFMRKDKENGGPSRFELESRFNQEPMPIPSKRKKIRR